MHTLPAVQQFSVLEQVDPYNPQDRRFVVCRVEKSRRLAVLTNHSTHERASDWLQEYLQASRHGTPCVAQKQASTVDWP